MKTPSKTSFTYTVAAYPVKWKKYVVSPKKICMQFDDVQLKTRAPYEESTDLKRTSWGTKEMPIDTKGTDIECLAVGIPLDLYPKILTEILNAAYEHHLKYPEENLKDFLLDYSDKIKETFNDESNL